MGYIVYGLSCGLWAVGLGCLWGGYGLWEGRVSQIRKVFSKFRITEL